MFKHKKAITIAELIIVISLLAILGIIGMLSMSSYLVSVRDSSRIVELENIESTMATYIMKSGFYPTPDEAVNVTYSGGIVWTQGTFGNGVSDIIGYSHDVTDPSTKKPYTYSIKNTKKEFSLAGVLEESPGLVSSNGFIGNTYAAANGTKVGTALVKGNYNGELLSVISGSNNYILALPSIISSDLTSTDLLDILSNNRLVYNDFNNLPASYTGTLYNIYADHDFSPNNLVVFTGSINSLKKSYNQVLLLQNLYTAYSGSILGKYISVNKVDSVDLFGLDPSILITKLACDSINFKLKYFVECGGIDYITYYVVNVLHIDISNLPGPLKSVYEAPGGVFIFGTNNGVTFFDGTNWLTYNEGNSNLVDNQVNFITEKSPGIYWFGTVSGISKLTLGDFSNTADDIWAQVNTDELAITGNYQYIYSTNDETIWIGTNGVLSQFNSSTRQDYLDSSNATISDPREITAIYTDSMGYIWFGVDYEREGGGIDRYKISNQNVTHYGNGLFAGTSGNEVEYILEDSLNRLWVGTTKLGLTKTENSGLNWTNFTTSNSVLPSNEIKYLFEDSEGSLWIGTKNGLVKYDSTNTMISIIGSGTTGNEIDINLIYQETNGDILVFFEGGLYVMDMDGNILETQ